MPSTEKVTKWLRIFNKFVNGKGLLLVILQNIVSNGLFVSFHDDDMSPFLFKISVFCGSIRWNKHMSNFFNNSFNTARVI